MACCAGPRTGPTLPDTPDPLKASTQGGGKPLTPDSNTQTRQQDTAYVRLPAPLSGLLGNCSNTASVLAP